MKKLLVFLLVCFCCIPATTYASFVAGGSRVTIQNVNPQNQATIQCRGNRSVACVTSVTGAGGGVTYRVWQDGECIGEFPAVNLVGIITYIDEEGEEVIELTFDLSDGE